MGGRKGNPCPVLAKKHKDATCCKRGHLWMQENIYWHCGVRKCRQCRRDNQREYMKKWRKRKKRQEAKQKRLTRLVRQRYEEQYEKPTKH